MIERRIIAVGVDGREQRGRRYPLLLLVLLLIEHAVWIGPENGRSPTSHDDWAVSSVGIGTSIITVIIQSITNQSEIMGDGTSHSLVGIIGIAVNAVVYHIRIVAVQIWGAITTQGMKRSHYW